MQKSAPQRALPYRMLIVSALGELEGAPRLGLAVLLALDHATIAREEAAALERAAQVRLEISQRLGDAVTYCASLPGQPTAGDAAAHVILAGPIGSHDRLLDQHAQDRSRAEPLESAL